MTQRFYLYLFIITTLSLSACEPTSSPSITRPDNSAEIAAQTAEQSGDYLSASQQYNALASSVKEPQKSLFYLRAALAFWHINQVDQVNTTLAKVNRSMLSEAQQLDAAILDANIALLDGNAEQALTALNPFDLTYTLPNQKKQALELKLQAYAITQNWLEKANTHISLDPLLNGDASTENQQLLWESLMALTPQALDLFNPGMAPAIDSGWFALAYLVKTYSATPAIFTVALEDWKRNYPNHPAKPELYQQALASGTQLPVELNDIAILLPDSGPFKAAADAIKRGIVAAHFNSQSNTRLHFLAVDTDKQTGLSNVLEQYQQAINLDASLVIGPLDKESVQILADKDNLSIPVLALNRLASGVSKPNLYQFGLAPEDDAIAVANYATEKNYHRALVLAPDNEWGNRIATAFRTQWLNNGGVLLSRANYDPKQNDFATSIQPLLGLAVSTQRYQSLKQRLGTSFEFEPRRRQDVDFIFLVAKPLKARQLVPQLKFHRSGSLPIIATSHAYAGYDNSQQDIDLNNLIISDMPWIFSDIALSDPTYIDLHNSSPDHFEQFVRLYALGADAYRLLPELNQLSHLPEAHFNGATGILAINESGQVTRQPSWATFKNGLIELLPTESASATVTEQ